MILLSNQQKELLFDYCLGIAAEEQTAQARQLLSSNEHAAKFVDFLKASLSPLETINPPECPSQLADGTVWRIKQTLRTSQTRLNELLKAQQKRKTGFLHDIFGRLVTAAVFVILGSALIMVINYDIRKSSLQPEYLSSQMAPQLDTNDFNVIRQHK
jgi:hypothetical protein